MPFEFDKQLLCGVSATLAEIISRDQLVDGMKACLTNGSPRLSDVLLEQGALTGERRDMIMAILSDHLCAGKEDPCEVLAALTDVVALRDAIQREADRDQTDSLHNDSTDLTFECVSQPHRLGELKSQGPSLLGGRFRILRPYAKGGLGKISTAEDMELHREVALKEIQRQYADLAESRSRFIQEGEITGRLEHPGIVPVYGMGTFADGRPFYAMRLIRGQSLKEAIKKYHTNRVEKQSTENGDFELRALLRRFIDICNAVEYAHSMGILHRDLKPSNVMLGQYGETLVVDWGLAKPIGRPTSDGPRDEQVLTRDSVEDSAMTQTGRIVGTLAYMSPEQAAGDISRLAPASDIYSLGATMYSLLTGHDAIDSSNVAQALKAISIGHFPRPSEVNPHVALPLQSICLKAMGLDPKDRYATPRSMADDIEKYLADEPVTAHCDRSFDKVRRWIRKHPRVTSLAAASLLFAVLGSGTIAAIVGSHSRRLAVEKHRAEYVADYLVRAFRSPDPELDGTKISIAEVLERTARELDTDFSGDPETRMRLFSAIGETYLGLGLYREAIPLLSKARDGATALFGDNNVATLTANDNLAVGFHFMSDFNQEIAILEGTLRQAKAHLGASHPLTLLSSHHLARAYVAKGDTRNVEKGIKLYVDTLAAQQLHLGMSHKQTLQTTNDLAEAYLDRHDFVPALALCKPALAVAEEMPDMNTVVLSLRATAASAHLSRGEFQEAIRIYEEALSGLKAKLDDDHPQVLIVRFNLARAIAEQGDVAQSATIVEDVWNKQRVRLGERHRDTLLSMSRLGDLCRHGAGGGNQRAIAILSECLELQTEVLGPNHVDTLITAHDLALSLQQAGKVDEAIQMLERTVNGLQSSRGRYDTFTLQANQHLADAYAETGQQEKAISILASIWAKFRETKGEDHPQTADAARSLATAYYQAGNFDAAIPIFEACLPVLNKAWGHRHHGVWQTQHVLALCYANPGRHAKVIELDEQVLKTIEPVLRPSDNNLVSIKQQLVSSLLAEKRFVEAVTRSQEIVNANRDAFGSNDRMTQVAINNLAFTLACSGRLREAIIPWKEYVAYSRDNSQGTALAATLHTLTKFELAIGDFAAAESDARAVVEMYRAAEAPDQNELASALTSLAQSLLGQNKVDEAKIEIEAALVLFTDIASTSPDRFRAENILGGVLTKLGEYTRAEQTMLENIDKIPAQLSSIPIPWYHPMAYENLIEVLEKQGKSKDAEVWRNKLAELNVVLPDQGPKSRVENK